MKYKVCTKTSTEVFDVDELIHNHKHNPDLCDKLKAGVNEIIYTITNIPGSTDHVIIFKRL